MGVLPTAQLTDTPNPPISALHVMAIGVRVGPQQRVIGYVTKLARTHSRGMVSLKQLEPYPVSIGNAWQNQINTKYADNDVLKDYPTSNYYPGEAVEVVPGPLEDETVDITRYSLFTSTLYEAFMRAGGRAGAVTYVEDVSQGRLVSLLQQIRPIDIHEIWVSPIDGSIKYGIEYQECWFQNLGHTADVTAETVVSNDATLRVTRTRPYVV